MYFLKEEWSDNSEVASYALFLQGICIHYRYRRHIHIHAHIYTYIQLTELGQFSKDHILLKISSPKLFLSY